MQVYDSVLACLLTLCISIHVCVPASKQAAHMQGLGVKLTRKEIADDNCRLVQN